MGDFKDAVKDSEYARRIADAMIETVKAVGDAIQDVGEVPSSTMYTLLMEKGCSYHTYTAIIDALVRAKLITNNGHMLRWVGPLKQRGA